MPPVEPECVFPCFPERAARWKRISGYHRRGLLKKDSVHGVSYRIPADVPSAAGVRIAFFSDLHFTGKAEQRRIVRAAAELVRDFRADYLLFGGDLSGYAVECDAGFEGLTPFAGLDAVKLAIPGNWESGKRWILPEYWRKHYAEAGFRYLDGELYEDDRLAVYGTSDLSGGRMTAPEWPEKKIQHILLTHRPDNAVALDSGEENSPSPALVLCGHLHGGQIRLPGFGALYTKSSVYGRRFDCGLYSHRDGGRMIISCGLGEIRCPVRLFCRREVVLLELC